LIEHLESYLGTMAGGSSGDGSTPQGVQVVWFPDAPWAGVTTLVTLGLSRRHLALPDGEAMHQELMMHVRNDHASYAVGLLFQVAGQMVDRRSALRHAQLIGPHGPVFPGSRLTAMVAISPHYMPERFEVCRLEEDVPAVFAWMVPITTGEADMLRTSGWESLQKAFAAQDPDLADPARPEIALIA
jgi:suppressor of fused protein SUFU